MILNTTSWNFVAFLVRLRWCFAMKSCHRTDVTVFSRLFSNCFGVYTCMGVQVTFLATGSQKAAIYCLF